MKKLLLGLLVGSFAQGAISFAAIASDHAAFLYTSGPKRGKAFTKYNTTTQLLTHYRFCFNGNGIHAAKELNKLLSDNTELSETRSAYDPINDLVVFGYVDLNCLEVGDYDLADCRQQKSSYRCKPSSL